MKNDTISTMYTVMGYRDRNAIPVALFSNEARAKQFVLDRARRYGIYHSEWIEPVDFYPEGNPKEL
jgi:hypothetical protein